MATFYEFFAGGGMARAGFGDTWTCGFANDFDSKKALAYQANWGTGDHLVVGDIHQLKVEQLAGTADLAWASFPCQDLSLAGAGAGLGGSRSGTFFPFWDLMSQLGSEGRAPKIIALENVCGTLTSHGGADFAEICQTFANAGYRHGALMVNASLFVPQSRPRLFMIGVRNDIAIDPAILAPDAIEPFHPRALRTAIEKLPSRHRENMLWFNLPTPPYRNSTFADLIEENPESVSWHSAAETAQLLKMMSPINLAKVSAAKRAGRRMVGGVYKRTRVDEKGQKQQRAEVRFDDVAGCLRTPAGGSSRQTILVINGDQVRSRLISARETARLMGLPDEYRLPKRYNDAYHLMGDGVAVPVVRHLTQFIFEPLLGIGQAEAIEQAA